MKVCSRCGIEKSETEFSKNKSSRDGLRSRCKACQREYNREYYQANTDLIREQKRDYYQANADRIREQRREYRQANADRMRERQREYRQANPEKVREGNRRRRARKVNARGSHTVADIAWLKSRILSCPSCGVPLDEFNTHVEHLIPLSRGGSDGRENLSLLCANCNTSKHDKTVDEYLSHLIDTDLQSALRYVDVEYEGEEVFHNKRD